MRFISRDPRPLTLPVLEAALRAIDSRYAIRSSPRDAAENSGQLMYGRALYAILDIARIREGECEELEELRSEVEAAGGDAGKRVLEALQGATELLGVEVKWQGRSTENTLDRLDPMWDWLNANRQGLIQADGEGFYSGTELILDMATPPSRKKPGPPCPYCGKPLRTELAKQCFECGADWHNPDNIRKGTRG